MQSFSFNEQKIVECFLNIHSPSSSQSIRKQSDKFLIECEKNVVFLLQVLIQIFQCSNQSYGVEIRLQSLLYLSNVIKRNWNNKKLLKTQQQLPQAKKIIARKLIMLLQANEQIFGNSLFDIVGFIVKADYPHSFQEFTNYSIFVLNSVQIDDANVRLFKGLRDILLDLAERKGFTNPKNYEEGPLKILNSLGAISEGLRSQLENSQQIDRRTAKLSKYCDQMIICLLRIAPYIFLDNQNFMVYVQHISQKTQILLTTHSNLDIANKALLQKDLKSLIYQFGCLQTTNPCIIAPVLSDYISVIFYIISKPDIFAKPTIIKYALLSMRKIIKEFTYFAENNLFEKSISSQPKSNNYLQLRQIAHKVYTDLMTEEAIQGIFNFLLTSIMNIKSKEDDSFTIGLDDGLGSATGYQKSTQKQLSVHVCGTLVVESLIERFPEKMLQTIFSNLQTCFDNNWTNVDNSTLNNFLSIISILPRSCKKINLAQFPIIPVLQYVNSAHNAKIREKFPVLINGWLDIFSNDQLSQLIEVLLAYVTEHQQNNSMQILLHSCFSLNKIITLRTGAINCGLILNKVFPVAIKVFQQTDNPQILWPLINLISSLLTKCQFNSDLIVSSVQSNSLVSLVKNQSEILVQALCQMFKGFLCIIPRNKAAIAVFKLIYHFLNIHLSKAQATYHQKCVNLWYYSIRQFSSVNQCNNQYIQLFEVHYKRCLFNVKPVMIYILEEYMLLGLIEQKLEDFISTVIDFYREGEFIDASDTQNSNIGAKQDSINIKIAALSFHITLITKYNLNKVNSEQMLYVIVKDFFVFSQPSTQNTGSNVKLFSATLQNSLLSIINRYILIDQQYFFDFLRMKLDISPPDFYVVYFKNMDHLTSRTAMKINSLALISLLTALPNQFTSVDHIWNCLVTMLKIIIPEVEQYLRVLNGQQGYSAGKIDNSPNFRFSQNILSERKQQIRKQGSYDFIDIRNYFLTQLQKTILCLKINLQSIANFMEETEKNKDWKNRLYSLCK